MSQYRCKVQQQSLQTQAPLPTQVKTLNHYLKIVEMMVIFDFETKNKRKKRKGANCVPKLIGNKKKNMERELSASQRDQLLLNESKEDVQFKKDLATVMQKSNEIFEKSISQFSNAIPSVAQSMQLMEKGFIQNLFTLAQPQAPTPPPTPQHRSSF